MYAQDFFINQTFYGDTCQTGLKSNQDFESSIETTQGITNLCPLSGYNISVDIYKSGFMPVSSTTEVTSGKIN